MIHFIYNMINGNRVIAIILARGGSLRVPGKNIKVLGQHPLVGHAILQAMAVPYIDRIICSTDDEKIADVAKKYGAEVPFLRPQELAQSTTPDLPCIQHTLQWLDENQGEHPDIIVHLRPTSPLRKATHIKEAIELLTHNPQVDSVRTVTEPEQSPYKMYKVTAEGLLEPLLKVPNEPEAFNMPQQSLPIAYKHVGYVDVAWVDTILKKNSMSGERIMPLVLEGAHRGINTPSDWDYYEYLFSKES